MADGAQAAVCKLCGGKMMYSKDDKRWRCMYCGTFSEFYSAENTDVDGIARQVIEDVAQGRLDQAERNLSDCTRKNQKAVATQIATISYYMGRYASAGSERESKDYSERTSYYIKGFLAEYPELREEETRFYNSFEERNSHDVIANLINLFTVMGGYGKSRVQFLMSLTDVGSVMSESENRRLLMAAIREQNQENIEKILRNKAHINPGDSCRMILFEYPDSPEKQKFIELAMDQDAAESLNKNEYLQYYNGQDSTETKLVVLGRMMEYSVPFDAMQILQELLQFVQSSAEVGNILQVLYSRKVDSRRDEEIFEYMIRNVTYCDLIPWFLNLFEQLDIYMPVSSGTLIDVMNLPFPSDIKRTVLVELYQNDHFVIENRAKDVAISHYLTEVGEPFEQRVAFLSVVLVPGYLSPRTVRNYLINADMDGAGKAEMVKYFFNAGYKVSFDRDLLTDYWQRGNDPSDVKNRVLACLQGEGFSLDGTDIGDYILGNEDDEKKLTIAREMVNNGATIPSDLAARYVDAVLNGRLTSFSERIMHYIIKDNSEMDFQTFTSYALYFRDANKPEHILKLLQNISEIDRGVLASFAGNNVVMNILQAYILLTVDPLDRATLAVDAFHEMGLSETEKVTMPDGSKQSFDKLLQSDWESLSETTRKLMEKKKWNPFHR